VHQEKKGFFISGYNAKFRYITPDAKDFQDFQIANDEIKSNPSNPRNLVKFEEINTWCVIKNPLLPDVHYFENMQMSQPSFKVSTAHFTW
jgi:hypothetical protein